MSSLDLDFRSERVETLDALGPTIISPDELSLFERCGVGSARRALDSRGVLDAEARAGGALKQCQREHPLGRDAGTFIELSHRDPSRRSRDFSTIETTRATSCGSAPLVSSRSIVEIARSWATRYAAEAGMVCRFWVNPVEKLPGSTR